MRLRTARIREGMKASRASRSFVKQTTALSYLASYLSRTRRSPLRPPRESARLRKADPLSCLSVDPDCAPGRSPH